MLTEAASLPGRNLSTAKRFCTYLGIYTANKILTQKLRLTISLQNSPCAWYTRCFLWGLQNRFRFVNKGLISIGPFVFYTFSEANLNDGVK